MGDMPTYRDEGIVLRTHNLGEADRIVTVLTRSRGKIRAVAKGVRRTTSRFGARLEPGSAVDLQCYEGRTLDTVTQAIAIAGYGDAVSKDYTTYTAAAVMLETADRLTSEHEPATQHYLLLSGAMRALAAGEHDAGLVLDAYLLRALSVAGWAPSFHDCARCGDPGPHRHFHVASGGAVCADCRPPGSVTPAPDVFTLLAALLTGNWATADASTTLHRRTASGLVTAFLQWHLERGLRALPHLVREPV